MPRKCHVEQKLFLTMLSQLQTGVFAFGMSALPAEQ